MSTYTQLGWVCGMSLLNSRLKAKKNGMICIRGVGWGQESLVIECELSWSTLHEHSCSLCHLFLIVCLSTCILCPLSRKLYMCKEGMQ